MRGNAARALLPALIVLALVGVVAIAATGSTPAGTGASRPPAATLLDTFLSLGLLAVLVGAVLFVYGLTQRKEIRREIARRRPRTTFFGFAAFMLVFTLVAYWRLRDWKSLPFQDEIGEQAFPGGTPRPARPGAPAPETVYEPRFAWLPVAIVLVLAVAGGVAFLAAERRRGGTAWPEETLAEQLANALDETLDDLRAEVDPRRAVIAAYARLERVLAAHGLPRHAAETPEEYLARILGDLDVAEDAVRRLTHLFSQAKFSHHEVDIGMKKEAIDALASVRDELRSATEPGAAGHGRPFHPDGVRA